MFKLTTARILALVVIVGVGVAIWYLFIPRVVLVASGNKSLLETTKSFVTTDSWSVTYSYKCSSKDDGYGGLSFAVEYPKYVVSKDDKMIFSEGAERSSTVHYSNAGRHYLQIETLITCPWHLVVKDRAIL